MLKIVFFCGSLEPGRDGVGDYTRKLAGVLISKGHHAGIVAINDQHITEEFEGVQETENIKLPILRLPSHTPSLYRCQRAGQWTDDFGPDWLSLQFVPFAFHAKGLPFNLRKMLMCISKGRRWHIMVHELWVGMNKEASSKFYLWGLVQKQLIKSLFKKLNPAAIHTQTNLYLELLKKMGIKSKLLPLFGNISVKKDHKGANGVSGHNDPDSPISFVVFGGIHPAAPIDKLAKELKLYSDKNGVRVVLKMLGRSGSELLRWEKEWEAAGLSIESYGEQSTERISEILSDCSFGISTTPPSLIEKSGSVAAMREHGLDILCLSRPWHPRGVSQLQLAPGVTEFKEGEIQNFIKRRSKISPLNSKAIITLQFVEDLSSV